jgi:rubrerythrin
MAEEKAHEEIIKMIKVIDKAILMERNARSFYQTAAHKVESSEGKKMFQWLADFEAGHESRLMTRRNELFAHPFMEGVGSFPVGEGQSMSEARPIELPMEPSDTDVLMIAIQNENVARSYYQLKGSSAPDDSVKATFEHLAADEEKHIRILSEQLKHLQVERFWLDLASFDDVKKSSGG